MSKKKLELREVEAGNSYNNNRNTSTDSFYFERLDSSGNEMSPAVKSLQDLQLGEINIGINDGPSNLEDYYEAPQYGLGENILKEGQLTGTFTGWGTKRVIGVSLVGGTDSMVVADSTYPGITLSIDKSKNHQQVHHEEKLGVFSSVSIAGCDLLGSCLYTAGICAASGGKLAPIGLLLVTLMLYFFRVVYSEVVTALPVNGGTYNLILNTSSKYVAAFTACLSLLSYTATAIVSAFDSVIYLSLLWPEVDIRGFTILILAGFGIVTLCGVKESANVTLFLFSTHVIVLTVLIIWGFVYGCQDNFEVFIANMHTDLPVIRSSTGAFMGYGVIASIYFGYSTALLGITGFETAANYVESMHNPTIFISTVNWMALLVGIYNPLLSFMSMMVMPLDLIYQHPSDMLAVMADIVGGRTFRTILCIDAVMILCGGVLTAIIGVSGLLQRLAKDNVMPKALAAEYKGVTYSSIICFTLYSIFLFLCIFKPDDEKGISRFGGVFAISFLTVLFAFSGASLLLKLYRPKLARLVVAKWWHVIFSMFAVLFGLLGNIVLTPDVFLWFVVYLLGLGIIVIYMFGRVDLYSSAIFILGHLNEKKKVDNNAVVDAYNKQSKFEETVFDPLKSAEREARWSTKSLDGNELAQQISPVRRIRFNSFHEMIETSNPVNGYLLQYCFDSLERIANEPFIYFAKNPDPISIHSAVEYMVKNESSDVIYIVHFVDDREVMNYKVQPRTDELAGHDISINGQYEFNEDATISNVCKIVASNYESILQAEGSFTVDPTEILYSNDYEPDSYIPTGARNLMHYVSILDTFYTYKKIHSIIVRGQYFCPSAIKALVKHLNLELNNCIMGVPDTKFKFPFSKISGVRIAVMDQDLSVRTRVIRHLEKVIKSKVN